MACVIQEVRFNCMCCMGGEIRGSSDPKSYDTYIYTQVTLAECVNCV